MLHFTQSDYTVTRWSGGTTTQIAIGPPGASYAERNFLWRISSAVVEDERSTFTPLPDYRRWLMLLEGSLYLSHDSGTPFRLEPFHAHEFDGGATTESAGFCRDFNLMLRKGKCAGALRPLCFPGAGMKTLPCQRLDGSHQILLLYCAAGGGMVALPEDTALLAPGESLLFENGETPCLTVSAPANFVLAEIAC